MGMYDDITVSYPLPDGYKHLQFEVFQTKDLDCFMEEFIISDDGKLRRMVYEYRDLTEEEMAEEADRKFLILHNKVRTGEFTLQTINIHGLILFYTYKDKVLVELIAKFTDGVLQEIRPYDQSNDYMMGRALY